MNRSAADTPTRDRLLRAATAVFASKGYHAASVDDLVAESGTSKGAFYHYFASKQEVFITVVDALGELVERGVEASIAQERGALAKVEAALRVVLETADAQRGLVKILLVEAVGLGPKFEEKRLDVHRRFAALIQRHLDRAVEEGSIPSQDTALAARAWLGVLNEVTTQWLAAGRGPLTDQLPSLRTFLLRSIGAEERAPARRAARARRPAR